ncbi:MAG: hypothetical protein RLZZ540_2344 [Bacteroidota bacterium]|jgi:hypothetical protein
MISCTLNQYKESFKTNLLAFLNEYEDNTKSFFLQNEKTKYQAYQKALTKIADQMKFFTREELNQNLVHRNIASDLKKLDTNIYNSIITELNPIQDETILSLSAAKKDRIKIDETSLEKHIKSSIVILKFISEENTETKEVNKYTYDIGDGETGLKFQTNGQLDSNLEKWLNNYEANFEYLHIPMIIEEKADYVTDTYKNYEQRYFEYQIEVCNTILKTVLKDKIILNYKRQFENNIVELRKQYPMPNKNIETIKSEINNAFFRLEKFMDGSVSIYQSFLFNDAFTLFFNELNKVENVNARNFKWRDDYHNLLYHIDYAFDKSEFKNEDAYQNEDFERDCNEICYIHFYRAAEFGIDSDLEDYRFKMPSIIDIVAEANSPALNPAVENKSQVVTTTKKTMNNFIVSHENLISDPLFHSDNEHIVLEKELNNKINDRLDKNRINDIFYVDDFDADFKNWQEKQNLAIGESFRNLVKQLNKEKTFFFGCSFDNYKHNYESRLEYFLEDYYDATEADFITSEEEFLENILYDIQNSEGAHDGYSVSGHSNFSKAYDIVTSLGYKQYLFSHNKKTEFLNERKAKIFSKDLPIAESIFEETTLHFDCQENVDKEQNNVLKSTIEDYLEEFKTEINGDGYTILIDALFEYFSKGIFPVLTSKINFKRINKKRVGWSLKQLYRSEKTSNLEIEYFRFAQENINIFKDEIIVAENFNKSKFYKVFTTNPAK